MSEIDPTKIEDITPKQAIQIQERLREKIRIEPLEKEVKLIGGADISFNRGSSKVYAGIVVLRLSDLKVVARSLVSTQVDFPYIPGLLAFRELPPLLQAWRQCALKPDVLIMDGHGLAHPRRMGIATHFGILADHPTIGCAKNRLTGKFDEPGLAKGEYEPLTDEKSEEKIGMVLRSRDNTKPMFISPGHKINFEDSLRITMQCLYKYKLPETTRAAHCLVNELRKGEIEQGYWERE